MTIQTIIFSKDRPLQLHATLASFALHAKEAAASPIAIIYCASSEAYDLGYRALAEEMASVLSIQWIEESNFKADLLGVIQQDKPRRRWRRLVSRLLGRRPGLLSEHLLFLVDDNIFIRPFSLPEMAAALSSDPQAIAFSLRVGTNTTSCYSMQCDQPLPAFENVASGLRFSWPGQVGDFGYPLEVSSSVYRSRDLIPLLRRLPYSNPNRLEQGLAAASALYSRSLPKLLCFNLSVAFCAPINKVQSIVDNRSGGEPSYSSEALQSLFSDGFRVDVQALRDFVPVAAHQEIELPMIRISRP